jgi:hypothetical protein
MRKRSGPGAKILPRGLVILHEDRDILVIPFDHDATVLWLAMIG